MTARLTLSVRKDILEKAKQISEDSGKSVSKLVEEYFEKAASVEAPLSPDIRAIARMVQEHVNIKPDEDFNYKEFIRDHRYWDYMAKHLSSK